MKVLITGGAGFVGSNLAKYLTTQHDVSGIRIIDDLSTGSIQNIAGLDVDFIRGSILDQGLLRSTMAGIDSIVHLAAIPSVPRSIANPVASHDANASGTLHVLEAARVAQVEHTIVASSSSVYGSNPEMPKNERHWTRPMSPYAVSKLATENYALAYQSSYELKTLALRFFNVYGPGQAAGHAYAAVIPKFLSAALNGEPLQIHGDGRQTRDFTYVGTVCAVLHQALSQHLTDPLPVNLAFGTTTSLLQLIALMEDELQTPLAREHTPGRPGDIKASQADGLRIRELFDTVEPVPLVDGLHETIEWFRRGLNARHHA